MFWIIIIIWIVVASSNNKKAKKPNYQQNPPYRPAYQQIPQQAQPSAQMRTAPKKRKSEVLKIVLGALSIYAGVQSFFDPAVSGLGDSTIASLITMIVLVAVGIMAIAVGLHNQKMYNIAEGVIKDEGNTSIDEVAHAIGKPYDATVSVISTMIKKNYFPGAYIDYQNRQLVMTRDGKPIEPVVPFTGKVCPHCNGPVGEHDKFCQHCGKKIESAKPQAAPAKEDVSTDSLNEKYINELERLVKRIDEQEFTQKLTELKDVVKKIYERVGDDPENVSSIRKFANIYMPAIINAVSTYETVRGANYSIDETLESRRDALDAVNMGLSASKNLLNQLYQSDQLNVSVELEMLKRMMAADGLIKNQDMDIQE